MQENVRKYKKIQENLGKHKKIYQKAVQSYNYKFPPEAIYCITKDAVKEIFDYNNDKHKKQI